MEYFFHHWYKVFEHAIVMLTAEESCQSKNPHSKANMLKFGHCEEEL